MSVVYIHVGLPKTGTTHVQNRLWRNRDLALRESGLLYPGNSMADHFHAAVHLQPERYLDWVDPAFADVWPTMVAQMKAWPGSSLISHELFSTANEAQIATLLDDVSFADEVHVIATVRDLARQLPSSWQENVKNQRRASFTEFVESVRAHSRPGPGQPAPADLPAGVAVEEEPFWEFQDYVAILARWAAQVGGDRVHVVTVPRTRGVAGDGLWERFLGVLGVDPDPLTVEVAELNLSLSAAQADCVRALNLRLQPEDIEWQRYENIVKKIVVAQIMGAQPRGPAQGLSASHRVWAASQAQAMTAAITSAGYRVVGSITDLGVSRDVDSATLEPSTDEVLDVALDTLAEVIKVMPIPVEARRLRTRAKDVVRRSRRRLLGLRRVSRDA
ncbi:sulfotransferase family protein [Gordonia sp. VNQ95]|jgi:hypothetical protein|uniref:sulfotransferase family protein n=1 Tax=Gordonia TaxID=2053 RepID=UPI0032B4AF06